MRIPLALRGPVRLKNPADLGRRLLKFLGFIGLGRRLAEPGRPFALSAASDQPTVAAGFVAVGFVGGGFVAAGFGAVGFVVGGCVVSGGALLSIAAAGP